MRARFEQGERGPRDLVICVDIENTEEGILLRQFFKNENRDTLSMSAHDGMFTIVPGKPVGLRFSFIENMKISPSDIADNR